MHLGRDLRGAYLRTFCPELFRDDWGFATLEKRRGDLDGKQIALVGNAKSLLNESLGSAIDNSDVVFRLNRGIIQRPESQGNRTDLLGLACDLSLREAQQQFGSPQIIWLTPLRGLMAPDLVAARQDIAMVPQALWAELAPNVAPARPSAGLIALYVLLNFFRPASVTLFGFDWKSSPTTYHDASQHSRELQKNWHDWARERELIAKWAATDDRLRRV